MTHLNNQGLGGLTETLIKLTDIDIRDRHDLIRILFLLYIVSHVERFCCDMSSVLIFENGQNIQVKS